MPIIRGPNQSKDNKDKTVVLDQAVKIAKAKKLNQAVKHSEARKSADEGKTVNIEKRRKTTKNVAPKAQDEKTRIVGGRNRHSSNHTDFMDDPIVGWLVILDGPGKGQYLKIGYGQNTIGRSDEQRIQINYGDDQISRENHAILSYEPKGRKFYIQQGSGKNLVYMNDAPVLTPTEISSMTCISLGNSVLYFVALCGPEFDWQDTEGASA